MNIDVIKLDSNVSIILDGLPMNAHDIMKEISLTLSDKGERTAVIDLELPTLRSYAYSNLYIYRCSAGYPFKVIDNVDMAEERLLERYFSEFWSILRKIINDSLFADTIEYKPSIESCCWDKNQLAALFSTLFTLWDQSSVNARLRKSICFSHIDAMLSPAAQFYYAKVMMHLAHQYNKKVFISATSPIFISAVEVFAVEYFGHTCNLYIPTADGIVDVTDERDKIYKPYAQIIQKISDIESNQVD